MPFCRECGYKLKENAKFCLRCGLKTDDSGAQQRQEEWAGRIIKCPSCGEVLRSFTPVCPACGHEVRGAKAAEAVRELADRLARATSDEQKAVYISNFPIPDTKEDIMHVMNMSSAHMVDKYNEIVTKAWQVLFERSYNTATMLFGNSSEIENLRLQFEHNKRLAEKNVKRKENEIRREEKRTFRREQRKEKAAENREKKRERRKQANIDKDRRNKFWDKHHKAIGEFLTLGFFLLIFLLCCTPAIVSYFNHDRLEDELEKKVKEVELYIDIGDYDSARIIANQIILSDGWSSDDEEKWADIRESLIEIIDEQEAVAQGKIKVNFTNKELTGKDYAEVQSMLHLQGFYNISYQKIDDLVTGWITDDGEVEEVTINGRTDYNKDDYFPPDVEIIISYHTF